MGVYSWRSRRRSWLAVLDHDLSIFAPDIRALNVREECRLPSIVGLPGQFGVHLEYAAVQLLDHLVGFVGVQLQRLEKNGDFRQDDLQRREGISLLELLLAAVLILVLGILATLEIAAVVAAISPAYSAVFAVTAR